MATKPTVGVTDPSVARQLERQTAQQNLLAGNRNTVVTDNEVIYNQAVARTASVQNANSVTITQSTNNDPGDITTVYSTSGALNVTSVDQTVNQYSVYNTGVSQIIAGDNITISSTIANGKGEVTINSTGGGSSYGNSNVTTLLADFGSNTISTTGNVTVGNISHTSSNVFLISSNGAKLELDHTGNGIAWLSPNTDSDLSGLYIDVDSYTMLYGENELRLESFNGNTHIRTATDSGNIEHHWEFTFSGNMILPGNTIAINLANGSPAFGNIVSINLDGNVSNVLKGDGTWEAGGGTGSELVNGDNSFVLNNEGNVVFEGNVAGQGIDRGLVWDYGANANGVNSTIRQDNSGITVRAWTEQGGGVSGYSAPVNIVTNQDATEKQWVFDGDGNLTLPGNLIIPTGNIVSGDLTPSFNSAITGITTGNPTVIVTLADGVFGGPVQGQVTISDVTGTTEANDTWYYEAVEENQFQLYTDNTFTTPVDGTTWTTYVSGGDAVSTGSYSDLSIKGGNVSIIGTSDTWTFGSDGNLTTSSNLVIGSIPSGNGSSILQHDALLQVVGEGANSFVIAGWAETTSAPGNIAVISFNSPFAGVGNVAISTGDNGNTQYDWNFDSTGALTLPGNGYIVNPTNSSLDPLNPNVSTMVFTPDLSYSSQSLVLDPTAPGHIHLRTPGANIDEPYANIFLGGEESSFEVGYYNGSAPNVFIHSGGNTWTFSNDGNLTLPGNTFAVNYANGDQVSLGSASLGNLAVTGTTINIANGASENTIVVGNSAGGLSVEPDNNNAIVKLYANSYDGQTFNETTDYSSGTYTNDGGSGGQIVLAGSPNVETYLNTLQGDILTLTINGTDTVPYTGGSWGGGSVTLYTSTIPAVDPTTVTSIEFNTAFENRIIFDVDDGDFGIYVGDNQLNIESLDDISIQSGNDLSIQAVDIFELSSSDIGVGGGIRIITDSSNVGYNWLFDNTGNLTLPGGNINLQPNNGYININTPYGGEISMNDGAGNTGAIGIESNSSGYITINNGGGEKLWDFSADGNLTIPGSILPETANTFDIGNGVNYFRDAYFSNNVVAESFTTTEGGLTHSGTAVGINANAGKDVYIYADGANVGWTFDITGNLTLPGNTFAVNYANGTQVSLGGSSSNISNGTSNVNIASSDGNVTISVGGTGNVIVASTAGANVTGTLTTTDKIGYLNGGSATQSSSGAGVTVNQLTGKITLAKNSWTVNEYEVAVVNCNKVSTDDYVLVQCVDTVDAPRFSVVAYPNPIIPNVIQIAVTALEAVSTAPVIKFFILKAPVA